MISSIFTDIILSRMSYIIFREHDNSEENEIEDSDDC